MHTRPRRAGAAVRTFALCLLFGLGAAHSVSAQRTFGRIENTDTNIQSYFYFVEPGAATIQVYVLGKLRSPGVYVLEEGANLGLLLALSGGPTFASNPDWTQTPYVRMFRTRGGSRTQFYEATLDDILNDAGETPVLLEGDVVTIDIDQRRRLNWRDVFTIISPILSTLLLIDRLTR